MEKYILKLVSPFNEIAVEISRKSIKNIHLKVYRDCKVALSVPMQVTDCWIVDFLESKTGWIEKHLRKYQQSSGYNNLVGIKSGTSTQLLGKDCRILKKESTVDKVAEDGKNIILYVKNLYDQDQHQKLLGRWWRAKAHEVYSNEINITYNKVFKKYQVEEPMLYIKKMKTLWGSCTPSKNKITLNEYLLKADLRCIQYVVLHELTHLLYPYHNKDFYDFLTIQMPDWRNIKKQLDEEVVQGL